MVKDSTNRTRWGRSRLGGGTAALLISSAGIGVLGVAVLALLFASFGPMQDPVLSFWVMLAGSFPIVTMLGWALMVDRATLTEAPERPEESVESTWYAAASTGTFHDLLIAGGLGAAAFSFFPVVAPLGLVLAGVVLFAMLDFGARYLWQRARGNR